MGTYSIVIEGSGINHNGTPKDADEMAKAFVATLRTSGHQGVKGYFVYGPHLATQLEATMSVGIGDKMLEPLAPTCDHTVYHPGTGGRSGWEEECLDEATAAVRDGQRYALVRCPKHPPVGLSEEHEFVVLREAVQ